MLHCYRFVTIENLLILRHYEQASALSQPQAHSKTSFFLFLLQASEPQCRERSCLNLLQMRLFNVDSPSCWVECVSRFEWWNVYVNLSWRRKSFLRLSYSALKRLLCFLVTPFPCIFFLPPVTDWFTLHRSRFPRKEAKIGTQAVYIKRRRKYLQPNEPFLHAASSQQVIGWSELLLSFHQGFVQKRSSYAF